MAHYIDDDEGIGIEGEESMLLDEEMDDDYEPSDQGTIYIFFVYSTFRNY